MVEAFGGDASRVAAEMANIGLNSSLSSTLSSFSPR